MNEKTLIQTKNSFFKVYSSLEHKLVIDNCLREIQGKLIENPPIQIYGKIAYQRREVGFF